MKYVFIYTLVLISVFHTSCDGQNQTNPPQEKIRSHRSGLSEAQLKEAATSRVPMSMVRNVRQAKNGDILIASYVGVYRYDGTSFTNMTSTIEWPTFWDVLEDSKGNLWLASQDSGVYFQPAGHTGFKLFKPKDGPGINSALHIYEDRAGNIWFGSSRYDGKSFRNFTTKDGFPSNNIRLLLEDKTGKLWFGAQGENMFVYDGKTFTVLKDKDGQAFKNVWSIIEDKKGNIWFGVNGGRANGLWRYDGSVFTKVSQRGVYAVIEDKKGNIWTTGEINPNGRVWALSRYDQKSLYNKNPTVTEIMSGPPAFLGLLEATDGSIWFGSMNGVYRYDGKTITDFKNAPTSNIIQHDIIGVLHTYTPPHVKGDKDFRGECDLYSTATLKISDDQTKLYIELYFKAKQPHLDNTEASGKETFVIYDTKNKNQKIRKVLTGRTDTARFIYRNDSSLHLIFEPYTVYAEWDMINGVPGGGGKALKLKQRGLANFTKDFTKNGLIRKWVFQGNMNSEFGADSRASVTVETDSISILVQENR